MNNDKIKKNLRIGAAVLIGFSALAVGANGVYASLNATATNVTPQHADSGTLSLTLGSGNGSAGFDAAIKNLAPGDVSNHYVNLTNGGTLASTGLSLDVAATGTKTLISDGSSTKALRVTVSSCSVAWDAAKGTCSGTTKTEVAATPLSTLASAQAFASTTGLTAGGVSYLQVSVALPDQNETTVNGVAPKETVQGGAVDLTYTFREAQGPATTTNR